MFRFTILLFLAIAQPLTLMAQTEDPSMQRLPAGVERSVYRQHLPTGGKVDQPRVEPPNWWTGMSHPTVEVLLYDQNIRDLSPQVSYPGVSIREVTRLANPNYLFVTLHIGPGTQAGSFTISLRDGNGKEVKRYPYQLLPGGGPTFRPGGVEPSDCIYLIMPDRFANGDSSNDEIWSMKQTGIARDKIFFRHGGDLLGIRQRLDYLQDMGITALWLNPVMENNQPYESYHGYAVTDHYAIDRRFGSNDDYVRLVDELHQRDMKMIMDVIFNHAGDEHWFIRDIPSADWIHQDWTEFTQSNFRAPVVLDPYASDYDRRRMHEGWFDHHMPDLNQRQPQLANYLIQNSIWWVAFSGHDGYRIDTYPYPDQAFMAEWARRLRAEFPGLGIFGEVWEHGPGIQAGFDGDNPQREDMNTGLPGLTDFQVYFAIHEALNREQGWTEGTSRLYYTLAQDYLYQSPYHHVTFVDNHDTQRFFSAVGEDLQKFKSGIAMLMTLRGVPMLYYGTEILMTGTGGAFGEAGRRDFPGGWPNDPVNKFTENGRSPQEQEAYAFIRTLARYRRENSVLQDGKLMQFVPRDNVYVYFRYNGEKTVMVAYNSGNSPAKVATAAYEERMAGYRQAYDIISGKMVADIGSFELPAKGSVVWELRP
jgi:neopullulanase